MTKALLTLLVAPAAVLSFTATPPPLYRTPAPLRPALHPRTGHVYQPAMMALPGREAADAAAQSPGKIRRVINFFKSPFTRNKETGALETPQVVDVEARAQPSQDSLLGNDDLLAGSGDLLSSGDDDLMASLRKRVNEIPEGTEEGETGGDGEVTAEKKPAGKLYDRRRQKAAPGGVAGTVLERPSGSTGMKKGPRERKPTGRMAKDGAKPKSPAGSKPRSPAAKKADDVNMDSVASNNPVDASSADEGPAMASSADIEKLNKLFGMGPSDDK
eukprot:CAMPEP_0182573622 /NCGR_PEP_ID=MMETSP1324-20130603/20324_1 /TAXON_ID=236786 /ORGANISM="Florenciella sp., Strain RCC1587" /LENGTH=272 /DNA_ID=CAMNT_0024788757 /DNA_START=66 /DNA_END=884 /DNA_ORIENTATION=-